VPYKQKKTLPSGVTGRARIALRDKLKKNRLKTLSPHLSLASILHGGMSLKVCGVTSAKDITKLINIGVKVIGINFWPSSKRYVSGDEAKSMLQPFENDILRVGVFVNEDIESVQYLLDSKVIDVAQLHGDESAEYCAHLKNLGHSVIKAFGVDESSDFTKIAGYPVDAILLDTYSPGVYGGTGKTFDWGVARSFKENYTDLPLILAGGITSDNIDKAVRESGASMIDVASGAEISPGVKCLTKVDSLLRSLDQFNKSQQK
jgi:phosphoribosylanthranilate isomerase